MQKILSIIVLAALCLNLPAEAQSQNTPLLPKNQAIAGKVIASTTGEALSGAVIKVTSTNQTVISNDQGAFILTLGNGSYNLSISHLSYLTKNINIQIPLKEKLVIALETDDKNLKEVEIVSTGYQNIPKERATGSFTVIDNKTLNRSVGINILDRLESVTSGLLINRGLNLGNNSKISVHGRSTLFAKADPLIILNGLPYDGKIEQINPADIETINILKDAAASSIWGTKSGNGVIVITTKSGRKNQRMTIGVTSTLTISNKPDLYYTPQISSSDFIDLEQYLFKNGLYQYQFANPYNSVSTAVEIFNQRKNKLIAPADSAARIDALKQNDIRSELNRYAYRPKVQQQYQLNLSGGTENHTYYLSGGYDKNLENKVTDSYDRVTLNANNTYTLFKDRLNVSGDINFASSNTYSGNAYNPNSPYDRMVGENGQSLPVVTTAYRMSYLDTAGKGQLLDWHYRPKDEMVANNLNRINQYRVKVKLDFKIIEGLDVSATYQFLKETSEYTNNNDVNSYYTRNLINQYSSIANNRVTRIIPLGSIYTELNGSLNSKLFRTQLSFNKTINKNHEINAIAGYEGNDSRARTNYQTYYGYDPETLTSANSTINPLALYPLYYEHSATGQLGITPQLSGIIDINQSFYANASYTYKGRYILSGSARRDESNIFGVKTNQKGVPLWSTGFAWNINREHFYNLDWLPSLKLRLTYGYNGNVDKTVSAYLTASNTSQLNLIGNLYSTLQNPPNPSLRWERIKTWNLGLDFTFKNNRVNGSFDIYQKNAVDLIGNNPIAFQSGIQEFKGNGANLKTKGFDVIINSRNLVDGQIAWNTSLLLNYNIDRVTNYKIKQSSNLNIISSNFQNPMEGYPYLAVFSFPSAGLDATGAPQGYFNNEVSKDYTKITTTLDPSQLKYHGSAVPKYFGSLINTVAYKKLELSINIVYKFDYFFRRTNVFTGSNYGYGTATPFKLADFDKRWKTTGDESTTKIPALTYPSNFGSNSFFESSEDLVEKGDHIRLQDIRLAYNFLGTPLSKSLFKKASIFIYTRNLGIIWRKNRLDIDPDSGSFNIPQPFSGSLGVNFTL